MGGAERVQRQKDAGRLTVRERIDALLDAGSFEEWGGLAGFSKYGPDGALEEAARVLAAGRVVVVASNRPPAPAVDGGGAHRAAAALAHAAGRLAAQVRIGTLIVLGGDTAEAVLGDGSLFAGGTLAPGTPWSRRLADDGDGPLIVTRAGGFGAADALVQLLSGPLAG